MIVEDSNHVGFHLLLVIFARAPTDVCPLTAASAKGRFPHLHPVSHATTSSYIPKPARKSCCFFLKLY